MSPHNILKAQTEEAHAALDTAMSRFDLSDAESYAALLQVHARVLPAVEEWLARAPGLPHWRRRTPSLMRDLADLDLRPARPLMISERLCPAAAFGLLYVVEGSRLGGRMLLRNVGAGLPNRFLSSFHEPGEWREFTAELNRRAEQGGAPWLERAIAGAELGFQLYAVAASEADPVD